MLKGTVKREGIEIIFSAFLYLKVFILRVSLLNKGCQKAGTYMTVFLKRLFLFYY